MIVSAGVALLLVIAAVNVLGVLVARAAARRREIAVRVALGAGTLRILRLSLAEGLTLAALGAALGDPDRPGRARGAALAAAPALRRLGDGRARRARAGVDVGPRARLGRALRAGAARRATPRRTWARRSAPRAARAGGCGRSARSALVVAQVALTVVLLVAAGLLTRTFASIQAIDPGFRADGVLAFRVPSATPALQVARGHRGPGAHGPEPARCAPALGHRRGRGQPPALRHDPELGRPVVHGREDQRGRSRAPTTARSGPASSRRPASSSLSGRAFTDADGAKTERVAIVDELLASRAWPDASPLGRRLHVDPNSNGEPDTWVDRGRRGAPRPAPEPRRARSTSRSTSR